MTRAKHAKDAKNHSLSFRPKGEIFPRSLALARDDGLRPVTWRSLRALREKFFTEHSNGGKPCV